MRHALAPEAWRFAEEVTRAGGTVVMTVVVSHTVHSPGTTGASHAIAGDGRLCGTIGGGIMEARAEAEAAFWFRDGGGPSVPRIRELHHSRDQGVEQSGMICAGRQTNATFVLGPDDHATVCAPVASALSSRGGGVVRIDEHGVSWLAEDDGVDTGWTLAATAPFGLFVIGGGHCGAAIARLAYTLGWRVDVVDTRPGLRTLEELPAGVVTHIVGDYRDAGALIDEPEGTSVAVVTADFPSDVKALDSVLGRDEMPRWVGVMGSEAKRVRIFEELRRAGHDERRVGAIRSPIGVAMKSDTPAEIAVSVAAELLGAQAQ